MELIDKYIYVIGQKLPLKSRDEIKKELTSLLLDNIEGKYGETPTEEQIISTIKEFGTPGKVAKRYSGSTHVIEEGFTDIYFMMLKIMIGAMAIAFFTIFIVNLFTTNPKGFDIFKELLKFPINTIQASFSGIGVLTVIFILISKILKDKEVDLEDDWSVVELESINLTEEIESKVESIVAIILIPIFIALINIYPDFLVFIEDQYQRSGLTLGNRIDMEVFRNYIYIFSGLGLLQVLYNIILLRKEVKTKILYIMDGFISLFDVVFAITILKIGTLFIYNGVNNGLFSTSSIGFKIFILISLVVGISELISKLIKYIKIEILEKRF